jgi:hypothetical protein
VNCFVDLHFCSLANCLFVGCSVQTLMPCLMRTRTPTAALTKLRATSGLEIAASDRSEAVDRTDDEADHLQGKERSLGPERWMHLAASDEKKMARRWREVLPNLRSISPWTSIMSSVPRSSSMPGCVRANND